MRQFFNRVHRGVMRRLGVQAGPWDRGNPAARSPWSAACFNVSYAQAIAGRIIATHPLKGARVLEVGPGMDIGAMLVLSGMGAQCAVIDPFPCPWDPWLHPQVYRHTAKLAAQVFPGIDVTPLLNAARQGRHQVNGIIACAQAIENAAQCLSASFDHITSNAVLEHVANPKRAFQALFDLTSPGGTGWHQVDYRDHRHFDDPLFFLRQDETTFRAEAEAAHWDFGNRLRHGSTIRGLESSGFRVRASPNLWLRRESLASERSRLHSDYCGHTDEDLEILGAALTVERPR